MATLPQFKQRQRARRSTSDIDRLSKQYKANVDAMTGEYQTAFAGYQAGVAEKMKPFEEQMATYKESLLPTYEAQRAAYQKKLDDYNAVLADIAANPVTTQTVREVTDVTWYGRKRYGDVTYYIPREIPKFGTPSGTVRTQVRPELKILGNAIPAEYKDETVYDPIEAPKAPDVPLAPTIEDFDSAGFEARNKQLQSDFKREVGERRAAKLGAVSRKVTRPLLSGEQG
jgi:hypothetical protein